jgi:hypothetical protein
LAAQGLQEVGKEEAEESELEQSAAVDYPLQANRLHLNFRQSRRMLSRAALQ